MLNLLTNLSSDPNHINDHQCHLSKITEKLFITTRGYPCDLPNQ